MFKLFVVTDPGVISFLSRIATQEDVDRYSFTGHAQTGNFSFPRKIFLSGNAALYIGINFQTEISQIYLIRSWVIRCGVRPTAGLESVTFKPACNRSNHRHYWL